MMNWSEAVAIDPVGERSFKAHVDEHWTSLQGAHGGIVAACGIDGVNARLASGPVAMMAR